MTVLTVPALDKVLWPTLGPAVCDFIESWLIYGPGDLLGEPARLDPEQRFLIYRMYEVYPQGHAQAGRRRFKRVAISQRKGTAKTEFGAWVAACELHPDAPVRVVDWHDDGTPIGDGVTDPYIPMVAYTEEQSEELAFGTLLAVIGEGPLAEDFDVGLERIMRLDGAGKAVAIATAPDASDGARTSFQLFDESHRLVLPRHRETHRTMLANIPKRKAADAWSLELTVAPQPGQGSIAEKTMDYAKTIAEGKMSDPRLFFFHRQASDEHDLSTDEGVRAAVLEASGPAAEWSDIEGKDQRADWYVFTKAGIRIPFLPEEVVHFRFWGTGADIVGPSSIEALRRTLQIEDAAQRQQIASFENANRPSGAFAVQQDVKKETLEYMRDQLHETYGGVDNAYKIAMLGGGAKWEPMSFDSGQAELISARHLTREECAAAYDMPPPVIQILDKATFSNVTEQHKMLYQDTLGPWLTMIEETLQTQLIDPEPAFAGQYVEFDLAEVLKGDIATRYAAYAAATWMSLNEKRERENLPPKESPLADALWMPPGSIPIHPDVAPEPIVPPPAGASAEELRCPNCSQLVGRNITGGDFTCRRCKTEFSA